MKYCEKCGKGNKDSVGFCVSCGATLPRAKEAIEKQKQQEDVKIDSFDVYNFVVTIGLMIVIRLFNTTKVLVEEAEYMWEQDVFENYFPDNIRMALIVVLLVSIVIGLVRPNKPAKKVKKPFEPCGLN